MVDTGEELETALAAGSSESSSELLDSLGASGDSIEARLAVARARLIAAAEHYTEWPHPTDQDTRGALHRVSDVVVIVPLPRLTITRCFLSIHLSNEVTDTITRSPSS